jgi:ferredoxin-NADP reductase
MRWCSMAKKCAATTPVGPGDAGQYRISVKREAGGKVSNHLHDQLHVGASIELFPPAGEFTLAASENRWC